VEIHFLKMEGSGEDTVLVDGFKHPEVQAELLPLLARRMLDRVKGVGAASILLLGPGEKARLAVRSFRPDGSEGAATPDALRCAARYASDSGTVAEERFTIESPAGGARVQVIDSLNIRVDLGAPAARPDSAEIREEPLSSFTKAIVIDGRSVTYTPVSLGAPFGIVFVPAFDLPFPRTCRAMARHPGFPAGTGIAFCQVNSREAVRLRVWQQGEVSSGSAAAAAAVVAGVVNGICDREVFVRLAGGEVYVQWEERDNHVYLTGPAGYVFTGIYDFAEGPD
jgi:diaminopimelate epimerase